MTDTYAEQAVSEDGVTRFDSTPVFPQQILDHLLDQEIVTQEQIDDARDNIRSS